jgi:hypothetical protein
MENKWKGMLLMISPDTHKRIEKEVLKKDGWTKTQWVREAIAEKLDKRKSK